MDEEAIIIANKIEIIQKILQALKNDKTTNFDKPEHFEVLEYCLLCGLSRLGTELRELAEND